MNQNILNSLDWPIITSALGEFARTEEGKDRCLNLVPDLKLPQVEENWTTVVPLVDIVAAGYKVPIEPVPSLKDILHGAARGQVLSGTDLRDVVSNLESVRTIVHFADQFSERCATLKRIRARLYVLPKLATNISRAIDQNGQLLDDASPELKRYVIKTFCNAFKNKSSENRPCLLLKTSGVNFSAVDRDAILSRIKQIQSEIDGNCPNVYLLHGELTSTEMNGLLNHEKVKVHVSFTHGEGFGHPLLLATLSGKPVVSSNWSGHLDFLNPKYTSFFEGNIKPIDA